MHNYEAIGGSELVFTIKYPRLVDNKVYTELEIRNFENFKIVRKLAFKIGVTVGNIKYHKI